MRPSGLCVQFLATQKLRCVPDTPRYFAVALFACCPLKPGLQRLERPAFAVRAANKFVGFGSVFRAKFFRVPLQSLADAIGDVAEMIGFGQPAGVLEVGAGGRAAFASGDPFGVMTRRATNRWLG